VLPLNLIPGISKIFDLNSYFPGPGVVKAVPEIRGGLLDDPIIIFGADLPRDTLSEIFP